MTVKLIMDNVELIVKHIRFSDGSSNVKIEVPEGFNPERYASISVDPCTPADRVSWEFGLVATALVYTFPDFNGKIILDLPYLPHARADRVFEKGNTLPLQFFFATLNAMAEELEIHLTDPHSDYYRSWESKFDFIVKPQHRCFIETVRDISSGDVLVSPDAGAAEKIRTLQLQLDHRMICTTVVEASKVRDKSTGHILETTLPDVDLKGKKVFIVDDILDGGATFIPLAQKLREAGASEVNLYITHGIFAKGLDIFKGLIDNIYLYQIVGYYTSKQEILRFNEEK